MKAEESYGKAIAAHERLVAQNPERLDYLSRLGGSLNNLGTALSSRGEIASAIARYREAIGHQRPEQAAASVRLACSFLEGSLGEKYRSAIGRNPEAIYRALKTWRPIG